MPQAQHQNGSAEVMIKMVKGIIKSFLKSMGTEILSLNEMMTLLAEVSNLVNERPIGLKPNSSTHPSYLSPNSLYLGRSSDRISSGPFNHAGVFSDDPKALRTRFHLVQSIADQFWKNWLRIYFPTLLVRPKWHVLRRNVSVKDIVLLQEEDSFRGQWRLGEVLTVFPDRRGNVRNVSVLVKPKQEGFGTYKASQGHTVSRHVSKLIVLVPAEDRCENAESSDSGLVAGCSSHDVVLFDTVSSSPKPSQQDVNEKQAV